MRADLSADNLYMRYRGRILKTHTNIYELKIKIDHMSIYIRSDKCLGAYSFYQHVSFVSCNLQLRVVSPKMSGITESCRLRRFFFRPYTISFAGLI